MSKRYFCSMSQKIKVHGVLLLVALIYGATYVIAKAAMPEYILPFGFILVRVFSATVLFWIIHALFIKEKIRHLRDYRRLFVCSIFGISANMLAFFKGLSLTNPINASLIMTLVPVVVLVASYFLLKEKITKVKLTGVFIGAVGAILLIVQDGMSFGNNQFLGDVFIFLNATLYGTYLVLVRPLMKEYQTMTVVKWVFTFGLIVVLPFGFTEFQQVQWQSLPTEIWWSIGYVVIGTTFLTYFLNAWALNHVSPSVVGAYVYLQPVFATFIAVTFVGETLDWQKGAYSLLIFLGVYLVGKK